MSIVNRETEIEHQLETENELLYKSIGELDDGSVVQKTKHDVICGDFNDQEILDQIKKHHPSLIVTSPPYNAKIDYDSYKDDLNIDEYLKFIRTFLKSSDYVLSDGGRIAINIRDIKVGTGKRYPIIHTLYDVLCNGLNYDFRGTHIWYKGREESTTAWGSFKKSSQPAIVDLYEYIYVFQKPGIRQDGVDNLTKEEFIESVLGVWKIRPVKKIAGKNKENIIGHPCPFPIEVPYRIIKLYSHVNDYIVDPFGGIGTTSIAAKASGRNSISVDVSDTYCKLARKKLSQSTI